MFLAFVKDKKKTPKRSRVKYTYVCNTSLILGMHGNNVLQSLSTKPGHGANIDAIPFCITLYVQISMTSQRI